MIDFLQEHDYSFNSRPPEEVDIFSGRCFQATILSIHDLPRRSTDCCYGRLTGLKGFQFTTSRGGRPIISALGQFVVTFQFTTSRGGRHRRGCTAIAYRHFQFTTSRGGRLASFVVVGADTIFQFTTSRGGRLFRSDLLTSYRSFNSRPPEEVDCKIPQFSSLKP